MKTIKSIASLLMIAVFWGASYGEIGFGGDVTVVSTYFWRGVKQFDGAALQSTAELSSGPLAVGYWVSSMSGGIAVETDPYVSLRLPTGSIESSIGATVYSYDFFAKEEYTVYELFGSAGFGPLNATYYFTPEQQDGSVTSVYWFEVGVETTAFGADLGATLGAGSYSAFVSPEKASVSTLLLRASRSVSDEVTVAWNWVVGINSSTDNGFFLSAGYGF